MLAIAKSRPAQRRRGPVVRLQLSERAGVQTQPDSVAGPKCQCPIAAEYTDCQKQAKVVTLPMTPSDASC